MVSFGSMVASPFMNVLYEQTKAYPIPYLIVSAAVVTLALFILIYLLAKRDRNRWETNRNH